MYVDELVCWMLIGSSTENTKEKGIVPWFGFPFVSLVKLLPYLCLYNVGFLRIDIHTIVYSIQYYFVGYLPNICQNHLQYTFIFYEGKELNQIEVNGFRFYAA